MAIQNQRAPTAAAFERADDVVASLKRDLGINKGRMVQQRGFVRLKDVQVETEGGVVLGHPGLGVSLQANDAGDANELSQRRDEVVGVGVDPVGDERVCVWRHRHAAEFATD